MRQTAPRFKWPWLLVGLWLTYSFGLLFWYESTVIGLRPITCVAPLPNLTGSLPRP